jgi:transposase
MRSELTDYKWTAVRPLLPNKPRSVRVDYNTSHSDHS